VFIPEQKDMFPGMPTSQEPAPLVTIPVLVPDEASERSRSRQGASRTSSRAGQDEEKMSQTGQVQTKINVILREKLSYASSRSADLDEKGELTCRKIVEACSGVPSVGLRVVHEGADHELSCQRVRAVRAALRKNGYPGPVSCRGLESLDDGGENTTITAADAGEVAKEEKEEVQTLRAFVQSAEPPRTMAVPDKAAGTPAVKTLKEWTIELKRQTDSKLGVDVDHADTKTLYVDAVGAGIVEDYNRLNPGESEVRHGDRIIDVNGVRNDIHKMIAQCKVVGTIKFVVQRDWE